MASPSATPNRAVVISEARIVLGARVAPAAALDPLGRGALDAHHDVAIALEREDLVVPHREIGEVVLSSGRWCADRAGHRPGLYARARSCSARRPPAGNSIRPRRSRSAASKMRPFGRRAIPSRPALSRWSMPSGRPISSSAGRDPRGGAVGLDAQDACAALAGQQQRDAGVAFAGTGARVERDALEVGRVGPVRGRAQAQERAQRRDTAGGAVPDDLVDCVVVTIRDREHVAVVEEEPRRLEIVGDRDWQRPFQHQLWWRRAGTGHRRGAAREPLGGSAALRRAGGTGGGGATTPAMVTAVAANRARLTSGMARADILAQRGGVPLPAVRACGSQGLPSR